MEIIAEGMHKTLLRDGDTLVKTFDGTYTLADVLNEALNQARVAETGVAIPAIRAVTTVDGRSAIVMDYVEGKTLRALMQEHPERTDEYLERFVSVQLEILSRRAPLLTRLKDGLARKLAEAPVDATTRYRLVTALDGMPRHNKLCHGSFDPANVILGADGRDYCLDWAHAAQGNASADVASTYLSFLRRGESEAAERYLGIYCAKSATARPYVERWVPIVAAAMSATDDPEERAFCLQVLERCAP